MKAITHSSIALVTGASSGFGLETAKVLGQKGYRVYAGYRNKNRSKDLRELNRTHDIHPIMIDTTRIISVEKAVRTIAQKEGRIDVLINNAGFAMAGFLEDISDRDLKDQFETNVFGYLRMVRAVAPLMRQKGEGKIINIGSISGLIPFPGLGAYVSSKFAVRAISESLRQELRPFGIEVTEIVPGSYKTRVVDSARYGENTKDPNSPYFQFTQWVQKASAKQFANGRPASEVAELIGKVLGHSPMKPVYLAGSDAKSMAFLKWLLPDFVFEDLMKSAIRWSRFPSIAYWEQTNSVADKGGRE
jgi:NAD(P)-dependent dehydrogenase (short-subunit alcohol dehydrogenase family)